MIKIYKKEDCCGCSACVHICPKHSISFKEDSEGFLYPHVDLKTCVDCGLCEKVCPVLNQNDERLPLQTFAAKHRDDEVRMKSSSGGIFTLLAEHILDKGGVVFGAKFNDNWEVIHDYVETKEGLAPFRGSKYVQSNIGNSYKLVEEFLKIGREVMFTGTPCQIAGLKKYLRKDYKNLLTVDFVCHGVPSPMVWKKYLEEEIDRYKAILTHINFRDKSTGWKNFSVILNFAKSKSIDFEEKSLVMSTVFHENPYMEAFMSNLCLRPSCYACPAKSGKSGADVTIGDFWGIDTIRPDIDDDKGVSLVLVNNYRKLDLTGLNYNLLPYENAIERNICIEKSVSLPVNRNFFMRQLTTEGFLDSLNQCKTNKLLYRVKRLLFRFFC